MQPRVAVICMPEFGHFQLMRPIISGLVRRGADVRVFTHVAFEPLVRAEGATFADLFARFELDAADDSSTPVTCRYVSYAGTFGSEFARELAGWDPTLFICETFALIGRVAAEQMGRPWVNVSPGHDLNPEAYARKLETDPRVSVSRSCHEAVAVLRERYGIVDASPFSFITSTSPALNLYCEPPLFLDEDQRPAFEPLAFFGALPEEDTSIAPPSRSAFDMADQSRLRVYVSFGTVVWRYFRAEALAAIDVLASYFSSRRDAVMLVSLGHAALDPVECARISRRNVRVASYVDQPAILRETDVFVTHHGINSTHEAIVALVPMLSYPFFWDQPTLAAKCQALGVAVPLGDAPLAPLTLNKVESAMRELTRDIGARRASLESARNAEIAVVAARGAVLDRLLALR